jgi:hypothetical protein
MSVRFNPSSTVILFLHNAKTAGRTLMSYLVRIYDSRDIFWPTSLHGLVQFTVRPPAFVRDLKFIGGHFNFGIHEPHFSDFVYFTLLREPVDRVASFYSYRKRSPQESDYRLINDNGLSLEQYVASGKAKETDNGMVRRISGAGMKPRFGGCSPDLLDRAKANIQNHFIVVGLQERFPESLAILRSVFGWPEAPVGDVNVDLDRPGRKALAPETVRLIERHNALDLELYRWAADRFEKRLAEDC